MSFGQNLQFLRKMRNRMTQEELAEKLGVSRHTVSKWELDVACPEMNKLLELCDLFSCSMDRLVREDICINDEAYSDIRMEEVPAFSYLRYAVVSMEPEEDALRLIAPARLRALGTVRTMPYPGFPTDAGAPLLAAACTAGGTSVFVESIFENRYKYVDELTRMGAHIRVDGRVAVV